MSNSISTIVTEFGFSYLYKSILGLGYNDLFNNDSSNPKVLFSKDQTSVGYSILLKSNNNERIISSYQEGTSQLEVQFKFSNFEIYNNKINNLMISNSDDVYRLDNDKVLSNLSPTECLFNYSGDFNKLNEVTIIYNISLSQFTNKEYVYTRLTQSRSEYESDDRLTNTFAIYYKDSTSKKYTLDFSSDIVKVNNNILSINIKGTDGVLSKEVDRISIESSDGSIEVVSKNVNSHPIIPIGDDYSVSWDIRI